MIKFKGIPVVMWQKIRAFIYIVMPSYPMPQVSSQSICRRFSNSKDANILTIVFNKSVCYRQRYWFLVAYIKVVSRICLYVPARY